MATGSTEPDRRRPEQTLLSRLERRAGCTLDFAGAAVGVSRLSYRRPGLLSPTGVLRDGCGTCSTKHWLLAALAEAAWPQRQVTLWQRPYLVTRQLARQWGAEVAAAVPRQGLVDVHTFATVLRSDGETLVVDVTFPLDGWDGQSSLPLHCGPPLDRDHAAGADPLASKRALVAEHCDTPRREAFLTTLAERGSVR